MLKEKKKRNRKTTFWALQVLVWSLTEVCHVHCKLCFPCCQWKTNQVPPFTMGQPRNMKTPCVVETSWTECVCPSQIHLLRPYLQWDGRDKAFGAIGFRWRHDGISAPMRRDQRANPLSATGGHRWRCEGGCLQARKRALTRNGSAGSFILGFQPPKLCQISIRRFSHVVCGILLHSLSRFRQDPLRSRPFQRASQGAQSCLILCSLTDCNPPGFSVHGILQARILEWVAIPFSCGSSPSRDWTHLSCVSCTAGGFFTAEPRGSHLTPV